MLNNNKSIISEPILGGNGLWYIEKEPGRFFRIDKETGKTTAGRPRSFVPKHGELGVTEKGTLRQRRYAPRNRQKRTNAVYMQARERRKKRHGRLNKEIAEAKKRLREVEKSIRAKEAYLGMIMSAPTIKEQRQALAAVFKEQEFSPIRELIDIVKTSRRARSGSKKKLSLQQEMSILKTLADFEAPKPKSVDLQADLEMSIGITAVDFGGASKKMLKQVHEERVKALPSEKPNKTELTDEDYEEFEDKIEEGVLVQEK